MESLADHEQSCADMDLEDLTPELRARLLRLVPDLLKLGMGSVLSAESDADGLEETSVDCAARLDLCRSVCCSFRFALTEDEVEQGVIPWDRELPHFIARESDGYCTLHDRSTGRCGDWENRPLRCRRYDCRRESDIWEDSGSFRLKEGVFDHLP